MDKNSSPPSGSQPGVVNQADFSLGDLIKAARPRQWTKNFVCFAAVTFADRLFIAESVARGLIAVACFCLASSAVYIINDLRDREQDQSHPLKRHRPIAAGRIQTRTAQLEALILAAAALGLSLLLPQRFRYVLLLFFVLNMLYSVVLKQLPILDVMSIALGFVLRVQSGIEAIKSPQSAWVVLCMFFMALFLAAGKRRAEILHPATIDPGNQRRVLREYSVSYLDLLLGISATTALVCYSLYAITVQASETFLITIIPVAFGILRYLMLVIVHTEGEGPDDLLTRDIPLIITVITWALMCIAILYFKIHLFPTTQIPR